MKPWVEFRCPWKRSLVELNGRADPNYRHYISTLIIDSYSKVIAASYCFSPNFNTVANARINSFFWGEKLMGQLQKRKEHFLIIIMSMGSLARRTYEFLWTHLLIFTMSYFDMIVKNEVTLTVNICNSSFWQASWFMNAGMGDYSSARSICRNKDFSFPVTSENMFLFNLYIYLWYIYLFIFRQGISSVEFDSKVSLGCLFVD